MKMAPKTDWSLNVAFPLVLGVLIYWAAGHLPMPSLVSNYLPGTGGVFDIFAYFFFGLALALNPIYEKQDKTPSFLWSPRPFRVVRRLFPRK
jgi:hypothetical protein